MERRLRYKCPVCGAGLRAVPGMMEATQVVRRKCKCGRCWRLVVKPVKLKKVAGFADVATLVEIPKGKQ